MNNYNQLFNSFSKSFTLKDYESCVLFLNQSFAADTEGTLKKLYLGKILFDKDFYEIDQLKIETVEAYRILLRIIHKNISDIDSTLNSVGRFSKRQLLQVAANVLEKDNAEIKYNENWNRKYREIDTQYLETERQSIFITRVGFELEGLLKCLYDSIPDDDVEGFIINESAEERISELLTFFYHRVEIQDLIERHLFFNWELVAIDERTIKSIPPPNQKESLAKTDIYNRLKSKYLMRDIENNASQKLLNHYQEIIKNGKPKPKEFWKYVPETDEERNWYAEAFLIDIKADQKVEDELEFIKECYFPGIENLENLKFRDGTQLPLRDTFRVIGFICELSKIHIESINDNYKKGVSFYSELFPSDDNTIELLANLGLFKSDNNLLRDILKNQPEKLVEERDQTIKEAKKQIKDEDCLIRMNYNHLIKTIQWFNQFEENFIRKVIDLFVYAPSRTDSVTRTPFFKIGTDLYWLPNMVAYASFAENLIEVLLNDDLISIHGTQTDQFEDYIKGIFKSYGYKVIENNDYKVFRNSEGKDIGDFDALAFKDGILFCIELKLTNTRNSYYERITWKEKQLKKACSQLGKSIDFIRSNTDYIRDILGLESGEEIKYIHPIIVSNSFLYDHEIINGYLKISYPELIHSLIHIEREFGRRDNKASLLIDYINGSQLFKGLDISIDAREVPLSIGEYNIILERLVLRNMFI